jgi:hypothetical protein
MSLQPRGIKLTSRSAIENSRPGRALKIEGFSVSSDAGDLFFDLECCGWIRCFFWNVAGRFRFK